MDVPLLEHGFNLNGLCRIWNDRSEPKKQGMYQVTGHIFMKEMDDLWMLSSSGFADSGFAREM